MRKAKSEAKLAAAKNAANAGRAAKKSAARAVAKAAAKAAAKRVQAILSRVDDGLFAVQSVIASGILFLLNAGSKLATQLHPPDI
jgi:hypothetical protein